MSVISAKVALVNEYRDLKRAQGFEVFGIDINDDETEYTFRAGYDYESVEEWVFESHEEALDFIIAQYSGAKTYRQIKVVSHVATMTQVKAAKRPVIGAFGDRLVIKSDNVMVDLEGQAVKMIKQAIRNV